jgi:opacity protein-like surface antigen
MKNVLISLAALAALSTAALAADHDHDLRDSGMYSAQQKAHGYDNGSTATEAFGVAKDGAPLTAFEIMQKNAIENERNDNNSDHNGGAI